MLGNANYPIFSKKKMNRYRSKHQSEYDSIATYSNLMEKWFNIVIGRFEWKNLPPNLTSEKIEKIMYYYGAGAFFRDSISKDIYFLPCYSTANVNVYGDVWRFKVIALNGETFGPEEGNIGSFIDGQDGVIAKNTMNYYPTYMMIENYVEKMVDIEGAMMVNINANKTPFALSGREENVLSMKNTINKVSGNEIALYFNQDQFGADNVQVLNTDVPYKANLMAESYHEIETRIFTILGINHTAYEKKERLVVDEVKSNDEYLYFNINSALNLRKQACEMCNKIFGTNIEVELRQVVKTYDLPNEDKEDDDKGGNEDA